MPEAFLVVSIIGSLFTFNAHRPRMRQSLLMVPSFFAGFVTTEFAAHHVSWQAIATIAFVAGGALSGWPGWLGLAITLISWTGLAILIVASRRSGKLVEQALFDSLGLAPDGEPERLRRLPLMVPFLFRDPSIETTRNIRYAQGAGRRHLLDVYRPRGGVQGAPVLLQIHGGGWTIGNKQTQALPLMVHMAARGWVCVAANYRLSPKATFPDHLVDLKLALRWIREHIAEYGGDPEFVAVTGGSAGGHLTAMMALTAGDPEFQPGFEHADMRVQAAVPFYGVYDFTNGSGRGRGDDGMGGFVERIVMKKKVKSDPEAFRRASPIHHLGPDAPPFMVVHGTNDSLAPFEEARDFVERLVEVSHSPVVFIPLPGAQHAFEILHSLRADYVIRGVERFLNSVHAEHLSYREGGARAEGA